jgi:hypothetical protein
MEVLNICRMTLQGVPFIASISTEAVAQKKTTSSGTSHDMPYSETPCILIGIENLEGREWIGLNLVMMVNNGEVLLMY